LAISNRSKRSWEVEQQIEDTKMRKGLAFALITVFMLAVSSAAEARGGRGFGGGGLFHGGGHGGRTFHSGKTVHGGKKTVHGGKTAHGGKKTVDGGKTAQGGKKTVDGGKTAHGSKTTDGSKTADGTKTTDGSKTADGTKTTDGTKTADSGKTTDGSNKDCNYFGLTPGQAMRECGSPDGRGASWYAHQPKSQGRLIDPKLSQTNQTNTNQTNTGTGLISDGAYRDPNTGLTYYRYHDPNTALTYYRTDGGTVQTSNGATYQTPTMRVLDTLGSFIR
jgi:hypothetical protein